HHVFGNTELACRCRDNTRITSHGNCYGRSCRTARPRKCLRRTAVHGCERRLVRPVEFNGKGNGRGERADCGGVVAASARDSERPRGSLQEGPVKGRAV